MKPITPRNDVAIVKITNDGFHLSQPDYDVRIADDDDDEDSERELKIPKLHRLPRIPPIMSGSTTSTV